MKKWSVYGALFIIIFGSLLHFVYEWSGNNPIVGIFSAVNESTWEHLKLLFWPAFIFAIVEYIYIGYKYPNYIPAKAITFFLGILLIITIFYTYTGVFGTHFLIVDILTFVVSVVVSQYVGYKIIQSNKYENQTAIFISLISIAILLISFVVFTFTPPHIPLFQDPVTGTYGIHHP